MAGYHGQSMSIGTVPAVVAQHAIVDPAFCCLTSPHGFTAQNCRRQLEYGWDGSP
jgi:hypothetical protein